MNAGSKLHFFLDGKRVKTRLKSSVRRPEPRPAPLPCAAVHLPQRLERACFVRGARRQAWGADRRRQGQRGQLNGDDQFSFQNAKSEIPVAIRTELLGRRLHISVWNSGGVACRRRNSGPGGIRYSAAVGRQDETTQARRGLATLAVLPGPAAPTSPESSGETRNLRYGPTLIRSDFSQDPQGIDRHETV